jgi:hypothetical protein
VQALPVDTEQSLQRSRMDMVLSRWCITASLTRNGPAMHHVVLPERFSPVLCQLTADLGCVLRLPTCCCCCCCCCCYCCCHRLLLLAGTAVAAVLQTRRLGASHKRTIEYPDYTHMDFVWDRSSQVPAELMDVLQQYSPGRN